jgi:glutaconate CoA-transferase subunit A
VPFLPVAGFQGSDLPEALGWKTVHDPYGGDALYAVPRLQPDWAVIHVPEADVEGNARIYGTPFWDRLMSRGARRVIITAETIVTREHLARQPELTAIPELFVAAVVHAPGGAWPGSCFPLYDVDYEAAETYASMPTDPESLAQHLDETAGRDRGAPAPESPPVR